MIPLGPFELQNVAGRGGMGEVWRAIHREGSVPMAVKVLTAEGAQDPRFLTFFRNEVRAVAGLDHPGIVTVFDHGQVPPEAEARSDGKLLAGSPYLVMEWASEGTLRNCVPLGSWAELRGVLLCLLDALAHAHARGVIHRDLKTANVLRCSADDLRPGLKLADFGIARSRDVTGEALAITGTPAYMAPEQVTARWRDQGPWTDLYALGCLVFKMAIGAAPFRGRDGDEVREAHLLTPVPPFHPVMPVPEGFEAWVRMLLAKAPLHRSRRAADAAWALLQLADPVEVSSDAAPRDEDYGGTLTILSPSTLAPTLTSLATATRIDTPSADATTQLQVDEGSGTSPTDVGPAGRSAGVERQSWSWARTIPPLAQDWRRLEAVVPSMRLVGAGLGLWGLRSIPLVDREAERDRLWAALLRARETGRARVALLHGPAGCGKSRLADWLCERAHEVGAAVILKATHGPIPGPADGIGPMLARHLRSAGLDRSAALARIAEALRSQGVTDSAEWHALTELVAPALEGAAAKGERLVRFRSAIERYVLVQRAVRRTCIERPAVLWLDDVQWGLDTLGMVTYLLDVQAESPSPLFIVRFTRKGMYGGGDYRRPPAARRARTRRGAYGRSP